MFESLVNTEGFQTCCKRCYQQGKFESLVNTEGFQTVVRLNRKDIEFESLVNTEGFQTTRKLSRFHSTFESLVNTEGFQTTITMLLTTAVLLVSVLMTGCTSLTEPKNSTPSGTDALTESDGFGVYIKLERDDTSSIALRGFLDYERLVCEKDSYI